jgi:hypothetical protein
MSSIRISTLLRYFGLALLAVCLNAGPTSAQVFQGKFTLASAAHWGRATLPAGDYWFALDSVNATCMLRLYHNRKGVALIMAQAQNKNDSDRAELTMVRGAVRTLNLPAIGMVLEYAPQHPKHLTAPEEREIAQIVPVASTGK